jgi:hypothetical protein
MRTTARAPVKVFAAIKSPLNQRLSFWGIYMVIFIKRLFFQNNFLIFISMQNKEK